MRITASAAISDPNLLGAAFVGNSWATWRAVLRAAEGLKLTKGQDTAFRVVADRAPPQRRVRELWVIAGRRAGKDSVASAIATAAAMGSYGPYLRPGEKAAVLCLAVNRQQARIVHRYIAAYFAKNDLLRPLVVRETDDGLELSNDVEIIVATNSYRSVRGKTVVCVILDEVAFWRDEESANPDIETYNALIPALITIPDAMLIGITTPYRKAGLAYQKWKQHFGKDEDDALVVKGPSTAFNPTLPQSIIDAALAKDPEAGAAEWLAEWRNDISGFLDRELIEASVDRGVIVRNRQPGAAYVAFCDPSGGRGDAFTAAVAHADSKTNEIVLDALYERRPPFDPSQVVAEIAGTIRAYNVAQVTGDRYAAEWVVSAFKKAGITYRQAEHDRSALYLNALPLFTAGRVRLLDHPRLTRQFTSLERRTSRVGRDRVDHGPGGHDDLANAVAGALTLAADAKKQPIKIPPQVMRWAKKPSRHLIARTL